MERLISPPQFQNDTLKELNKIRYGRKTPLDKAHADYQRKQACKPNDGTQIGWFNSMKSVIGEIDEVFSLVPCTMPLTFLDMGCCPGGFSSYILQKNPYALGVGVSLPVGKGGHAYLLEDDLRSRFWLYWGDITRYQLGYSPVDDDRLGPLPPYIQEVSEGNVTPFDLVILDGHPLRSSPSQRDEKLFLTGDQLLICQLIIALSTTSTRGGTILMKLSKPERQVSAQIMHLFDILSLDLRSWKPVCMHATRATFYIIAKGFGLGRQSWRLPQLLEGLQNLWVNLVCGGASGRGRRLGHTDLDFIIDKETIANEYGERLWQLSAHIFETQKQSLEGWHQARSKGF